MAERKIRIHPFTESKLKSDITSLPSKKAYSNIISVLSYMEREFRVGENFHKVFFLGESSGVSLSARLPPFLAKKLDDLFTNLPPFAEKIGN
jgi:hypothetical protein